MTDLSDFGVEGEPAPRLKKAGRLLIPWGGRTRTAGWYGPTNRSRVGLVSERDSQKHRIHALDAYAISSRAVEKAKHVGVTTVFIAETDSDDVLEYRLDDFDTPVPDQFLQRDDDPQVFATRDEAREVWEDHRGDFLVPRGERVEP